MIDALINYGLFAAKSITVIIAVALLAIFLLRMRQMQPTQDDAGRLEIADLSERYREMALGLKQNTLPPKVFKQALKVEQKAQKEKDKALDPAHPRPRLFVIDFHGDLMATEVQTLRELVSVLLLEAQPIDEVLIRLENTGGAVHEHGLAASQLLRLKTRGIRLTVAVDKIAASGGYLMAVVADRILAAPFAVIGSIGVVAQLPNFHRWLTEHGVDFELHTAGDYKRTLTLFGENTDAGRAKLQAQLEDVHHQFKQFIMTYRQQLDISRVATGEYWHGEHALALGLVDEICTSDDYLLAAYERADLFKLRYEAKKKPLDRVLSALQLAKAQLMRPV
ncbi:protease SohB [Thiospirillum jenense]|uniref:Protease SohB n=1 Tax=Thiospirillum jenense TaxID=1653858 RepID=A0A839HI36_9GAMM|nr:protease SohB [Thiospirillum jenense]MBB1126587.1 protease SohB [Thiospirillum jenense]